MDPHLARKSSLALGGTALLTAVLLTAGELGRARAAIAAAQPAVRETAPAARPQADLVSPGTDEAQPSLSFARTPAPGAGLQQAPVAASPDERGPGGLAGLYQHRMVEYSQLLDVILDDELRRMGPEQTVAGREPRLDETGPGGTALTVRRTWEGRERTIHLHAEDEPELFALRTEVRDLKRRIVAAERVASALER